MSPIKPENKDRYPENWREISTRIKERAGWRCECTGECGINHLWQNETRHRHWTMIGEQRCSERHGLSAIHFKGDVRLTVAHYPDHDPANCADDNLLALCQRCHNRIDAPTRAAHRRAAPSGTEPLFALERG